MISSLIGFLTSPLGIALLIGAFSGGARLWAKVQEQRARQAQIQARRQMERDALRTGGRALETQTQTQPTQRGAWDQDQQRKRDRIEELRRRRIEQLQKLREQRASASSARSSVTTPAPIQAPRRAPAQARPARQGAQRVVTPTMKSRRPAPSPMSAQQTHRKPTAPRVPGSTPGTSARRAAPRPPEPQPANPIAASEPAPISEIRTADPVATSPGPKRFASRQALRDAIIAREVLGPPVALREEHAADPFVL